MSERGQEQTSNEGSAVAKPKPMCHVQSKAKPTNLVSKVSHSLSRWSERSSSTTLSNPENPGKALTNMPDVDRSFGKMFDNDCDTSDNGKHSQVRKQENVQCTETWKQAKVTPSDGSFRKRSSNAVNTDDTGKDFRNKRITDSDYISKIFRFFKKKLGIQERHESLGIVHVLTDEGSNPLGQNYERNLETYKSTNFEQVENLFSMTQNVVVDNSTETLNVKKINCRSLCWTRSTQAHDQVKRWSQAKLRVYSDSGLCLGKMSSGAEAKARWSSQVEEFKVYYAVEEFLRIDGEAIEFEWHIFPGFTTLQILQQIENDLQCQNVDSEQFPDRTKFMPMYNDIEWEKRNMVETCISNPGVLSSGRLSGY